MFGCVQVVVKFIRKSKLSAESWVKTDDDRYLPREVYLLLKLHHPNIVKVSSCTDDIFSYLSL